MGFMEWFKKGSKGLLDMSDGEIRTEERFLQKDKDKLARRLERLATEREHLFQRGAKTRNEDLRKAVALEYELKTSEMTMASRELLLKSKEILTLSRVRQIRRAGKVGAGGALARLSETDQVRLQRLVADAEVHEELYSEKLDELLTATAREGGLEMALGAEGKRVLDIWQRMDDGEITDIEDAKRLAEIERPLEGPEPTEA
ncbi:MAG: hypothetical protein AMS14_10295 [Planctomycetes bacterium DG_20]|nr:MAG: hypothetical protein AMS14_10295 [Planctomycetes bacterium DG_20]